MKAAGPVSGNWSPVFERIRDWKGSDHASHAKTAYRMIEALQAHLNQSRQLDLF